MVVGFETLNLQFCELEIRELTIGLNWGGDREAYTGVQMFIQSLKLHLHLCPPVTTFKGGCQPEGMCRGASLHPKSEIAPSFASLRYHLYAGRQGAVSKHWIHLQQKAYALLTEDTLRVHDMGKS